MPTIRNLGEFYLERPSKHFTTLIRVNMSDFDCDVPREVERISGANVAEITEANEEGDREEFMERQLPRLRKEDGDSSVSQRCSIVDIKAGALEGVRAIYEAVKKFCAI